MPQHPLRETEREGMNEQVGQGDVTKLVVGDMVPDVSVMLDDRTVSLRECTGTHNLVLYFYPKDSSSVCALEARAFNELVDDFAAAETTIIGVSMDGRASHARFAAQEGLRFQLGTDPDRRLVDAFSAANRLVLGIATKRVTFLIGKDGRIVRIWNMVNPLTHALDVLDTVHNLMADAA